MSMSGTNRVMLVSYKRMPERELDWMLDNSHTFGRKRLNEILAKLIKLATANDLIAPLEWKRFVANKEVVQEGVFSKKDVVYGEYSIGLEFNRELTEEEYTTWFMMIRTMYHTLTTK